MTLTYTTTSSLDIELNNIELQLQTTRERENELSISQLILVFLQSHRSSREMWFYFLLAVLGTFDVAMASNNFDFGDALALILGLTIAIVGFFACMGAYARRQSHFESL